MAREPVLRGPGGGATRLLLILALAAGLVGLTLVAAPAHAGDGGAPVRAALGAAPAPDPTFIPGLIAPVGEELRGSDYGWDWRHCVQVVADLRASPPTVPLVVLLGGSAARECLMDDEDWRAQIQERSGYVVDACDLGSKHRSFAQDLAFVRLLPEGVPTIVYIGVNLGRFCLPPGAATITLPEPKPFGRYSQHLYRAGHVESRPSKRRYVRYWLRVRYPEFRTYYASQLRTLQQIVRVCKQRGFHVALLDLPRDLPVIGSAFYGPVSRYQAGCSALAELYDIPWLHFDASAHFVNTDFFDIFHLVEPGRAKYQSILSDRTIALLKKYHMPEPQPSPSPSGSPSPGSPPSPTTSPSESPSE